MCILPQYIIRKQSRTKWHNQPFPKESQEKILHPKRVNYRKLDKSIQKRFDVPILITDSQEFYEGKRSTPYRSREEFDSVLSADYSSKFENTPPSFALDTPRYYPSGLSKSIVYVSNQNENQNGNLTNNRKDFDEQLHNISEIPVINESTYSEASKRKRRADNENDEDDESNISETQDINSKSSIYDQCQEIINKLDNLEGKKNISSLKPLKKRKKENELIREVLKRKLTESISNSQNRSTVYVPKKKFKLYQQSQTLESELKRSIEMESVLSQEFSRPLKEANSDGDELLLFPLQKLKQNNSFSRSENVYRKKLNDLSSIKEPFKDSSSNKLPHDEEKVKKENDNSEGDIEEVKNESNNSKDNNNDDDTSNSSLNDEDFSFDSENGSPKPVIKPNSEGITDNSKICEIIVENKKNKDNILINANESIQNPTIANESHLIGQNHMQHPKATSPFSQFDKHIQISIPKSIETQPSLFSTPTQSQSLFQPKNTQNDQIKSSSINFGNNNNISSLFSMNEPKTNSNSIFQQNKTNNADSTKSFGIKSAPKGKGKKFQIKKK